MFAVVFLIVPKIPPLQVTLSFSLVPKRPTVFLHSLNRQAVRSRHGAESWRNPYVIALQFVAPLGYLVTWLDNRWMGGRDSPRKIDEHICFLKMLVVRLDEVSFLKRSLFRGHVSFPVCSSVVPMT